MEEYMQFELVHDADVKIAETPIWDKRNGCLYWTAMFEGKICEWNPVSRIERRWDTGGKWVGSAIPCQDPAKLVAVIEGGIFILDKETGKLDLLVNPEPDKPQNRYNDARADARGRILVSSVAKSYGTPAYTPDQKGAFYLIEKNGKFTKIVEEINQYNGIVWAPDNKKLYVADTYNETLLQWDYDPDKGPVGEPRVVADFRGKQGMPDGLSMDTEGSLYVTHWNTKISIWDKNLDLKEDVVFPVEQACCGGFGGEDMKDFYVSSARYGYTADQLAEQKGAGGIFKSRLSIAGLPDNFF
jgi:sugar lactone lactonase YvrE